MLMLKGHTKIELTDVNTGEVETIEKDNMVTNALNKFLAGVPFIKGQSNLLQTNEGDLLHELLGGILLFDTSVEENVNTIFAPPTVKPVGCGSYKSSNSGVNVARGSYNETESSTDTDKGVAKFVYDFSTAQANGKIACVALTHQKGGLTGYGDASCPRYQSVTTPIYSTLSYAKTIFPVTISTPDIYFSKIYGRDVKYNDYLYLPLGIFNGYFHTIKEVKTDTNELVLNLSPCPFYSSISIMDNLFKNTDGRGVIEKKIKWNSNNLANLRYGYSCGNNDERKIYLWTPSRSSNTVAASSDKLDIIEISVDDFTTKTYTVNTSFNFTTQSCYVANGHIYIMASDNKKIYKIKLSNPTDITEIPTTTDSISLWTPVCTYQNGRLYYAYPATSTSSGRTCMWVLNTEDNTVNYTEVVPHFSQDYCLFMYAVPSDISDIFDIWLSAPRNTNPQFYDSLAIYTSYIGLVPRVNYLATINNLESPVVKTADKTMKITYTITEVE